MLRQDTTTSPKESYRGQLIVILLDETIREYHGEVEGTSIYIYYAVVTHRCPSCQSKIYQYIISKIQVFFVLKIHIK